MLFGTGEDAKPELEAGLFAGTFVIENPLEWKGLKEEFVYLTINELVPENDHHQIFDLFDLLLEAHRDYFLIIIISTLF